MKDPPRRGPARPSTRIVSKPRCAGPAVLGTRVAKTDMELFSEMSEAEVDVELERTRSQIRELQEDWRFVVASACVDENFLGKGSGCEGVYGLTSPITGESYAVKKVLRSHAEANRVNFQRELDIGSQVQHPGVCRLRTVVTDQSYHMLVFERCKHELFDSVRDAGGLSEPRACAYFGQIIDALDYLHSLRIYHRDLKLENVLVTDDDKVKINDFDHSRQCSVNSQPGTRGKGTVAYMAPEMISSGDAPYVGAAVDVWSCGAMLYVMVCCAYP